MKHLLIALAAVMSFGSTQARHAEKSNGKMKGSDTISIVNKTDKNFEKVIIEVQFVGEKGYYNHQSYVSTKNLKGGATAKANLLNASTHRCQYPHHKGENCQVSSIAKEYGNDAKNVKQILIRHISAGKADTYVSNMKAQGAFLRPFTAPQGTMARNFEIVETGHRMVIRPVGSQREMHHARHMKREMKKAN